MQKFLRHGLIALLGLSPALLAAGPRAAAPESKDILVVTVTGQIEVVTAKGKTTLTSKNQGFVVPPGATVRVLSGSAVFKGPGVAVKADDGAVFQYTAEREQGTTKLGLKALPGSKPIQVEVKNDVATLYPGAAVRVQSTPNGEVKLFRTEGVVMLRTPSGQVTTYGEAASGEEVIASVEKKEELAKEGEEISIGSTAAPPPPSTPSQDLEQISPSSPQ